MKYCSSAGLLNKSNLTNKNVKSSILHVVDILLRYKKYTHWAGLFKAILMFYLHIVCATLFSHVKYVELVS